MSRERGVPCPPTCPVEPRQALTGIAHTCGCAPVSARRLPCPGLDTHHHHEPTREAPAMEARRCPAIPQGGRRVWQCPGFLAPRAHAGSPGLTGRWLQVVEQRAGLPAAVPPAPGPPGPPCWGEPPTAMFSVGLGHAGGKPAPRSPDKARQGLLLMGMGQLCRDLRPRFRDR